MAPLKGILFLFLLPLTLTAGQHKLLILLLDGWRQDYVNKMTSLPGFQSMAAAGVVADFVRPSFPTLNYPSYYTLMTGARALALACVGVDVCWR